MRTSTEVHGQLEQAGLLPFVRTFDGSDGQSISGTISLFAIRKLEADPRFISGPLHLLHGEVGAHRIEFRSHRGELGSGSLQIVIDKQTGHFHADLDEFSPYDDAVGFAGHGLLEVVPYFFKKLFRRKEKPKVVKDMTGQEFPQVED